MTDILRPAVSVITPVWNAADTLARTVASVQDQTQRDWEMILVDDGSSDASPQIAQTLAQRDPRLRVIGWSANQGAAAARNAAIRASRGRFIAFLDADDLWVPHKLETQLAFMAASGAPFVYSAYRRVDAAGAPLGLVRVPDRITRRALLRSNVIGCLTVVYDTECFGRAEMPDLRRRQDYALWLDLLDIVPEARGLPQVLADYRVRPGSLSAHKLTALAATWALYRGPAKLGRTQSCWYMANNIVRALARRTG